THLAGLALQQIDLPCRRMRLRLNPGNAATGLQLRIDTPLLPEQTGIGTGARAGMTDEFGYIETDTAGTDDRDLLAHWLALQNSVEIADHLRMLHTGDRRHPRHDAGGQDHLVELCQIAGGDPGIE